MNRNAKFLMGIAAAATLAVGCVTKPAEPVNIEKIESISATVTAVDVKKRLVSLVGTEGRTATIEVPADVRNLAQVKVGDKLVVKYYESLGAALKPKGSPVNLNTTQDIETARAAAGAKPGAALGTATTTTILVQSVDKKTNTVWFSGPDGLVRSVQVQDPAAQKFAATLKKGDQVDLTYTEALAVSVEAGK